MGPHAADSGKFGKKRVLRKSMDEFPNPLDVESIGENFGDLLQPNCDDY